MRCLAKMLKLSPPGMSYCHHLWLQNGISKTLNKCTTLQPLAVTKRQITCAHTRLLGNTSYCVTRNNNLIRKEHLLNSQRVPTINIISDHKRSSHTLVRLNRFKHLVLRDIPSNRSILTEDRSIQLGKTFRRNYRSAIFNSDIEGNTSNFEFDHNLESLMSNLEGLRVNIQRRGSNIDVDKFKQDYDHYCELKDRRERLESRREAIAKQIAAIVKHQKQTKTPNKEMSEKLKSLKIEGKEAKETLKSLLTDFFPVEENLMIAALNMPNSTLPSVTDKLQIIEEYFSEKKPSRKVNHFEMLDKSRNVQLSNIGAKAYYLSGRLAVLEQELIDRFSTQLTDEGFTLILAPEMFKTAVVEGSGLSVLDPASVYRLQAKQGASELDVWNQDHMFLVGCSHLSFTAYYARHLITSNSLPIRNFCVGRSYRPESNDSAELPGLFSVLQSVKVAMACLCQTQAESLKVLEEFQSILTNIYSQFELPFRFVSVPYLNLQPYEQNRIELQIWVPSMEQYVKVGSVSVHGDYCSRRLMIRHAEHKHAVTLPVHVVYAELMDITKMVALLMEYGLTEKHWGHKVSNQVGE